MNSKMRSLFRSFLLVTVMTVFCGTTYAQNEGGERRVSREQLAERQANRIADEMAFSGDVRTRFIDTYSRCQKEIWEIGPKQGARPGQKPDAVRKPRGSKADSLHKGGIRPEGSKPADSNVDSLADAAIKARFDRSQKLLDIREKYYAEYCKFLTPTQIKKVYEVERQMRERLEKRSQERSPQGKGSQERGRRR